MVSEGIKEKGEGESMGSGVQQRGLFACFDEQSDTVGKKMPFGINDAETSDAIDLKDNSIECWNMEASHQCTSGVTESESKESDAVEVGAEMRDDCEESARQGGEKATAGELMSRLQLQQFRCALTGDRLTPEVARCDHVIPVSEGGSNRIDNLQWVTDDVNRAKGVMSQDAFISMCIKVAKWARR